MKHSIQKAILPVTINLFGNTIRTTVLAHIHVPGGTLLTGVKFPRGFELNSNLEQIGVSKREREVMERNQAGLSNKEIASELGIAERTVKFHMSSLFVKFGVENRIQLARLELLMKSGNQTNG